MKTKIVSCHTDDSKPVKQEVTGTVILPPLVFPDLYQTSVAQQSVTQIISATIMNMVTPKAGAKREPLFNKPASEVGFFNI